MSPSPPALPSPRHLLTSILNQISKIPPPTAGGDDAPPQLPARRSNSKGSIRTRTDSFPAREQTPPQAANPLRRIDPSHRPLFTTLHVLFPSLLLPALDLLDRGLVTRLAGPGESAAEAEGALPAHLSEDASHAIRQEEGGAGDSTAAPSSVYLVRSAQKPTRRPYGGDAAATTSAAAAASTASGVSQKAYVVHTAAWNCTCAAFAFAAFPPLAGAPTLPGPGGHGGGGPEGNASVATMSIMDDNDDDDDDGADEGRGGWKFGGDSFDGRASAAGGVPPCCKHLLACVLAERWEFGLGRYVARRELGREEMAGVFADV